MALNKAVLALAIAVMVLMASAVPAAVADDFHDCYCDCMINTCIKIPKATKEECAPACSDGCTQAGFIGQPNPGDFCGL